MSKKKDLFEMFVTLFKIGLFTFGGGYAMLALLESELVSNKKWMEKDEFLDMVAIAESTPGPIAINSATYIGYKKGGVLGSAVATSAICLPSFIIIYIISIFLDAFLTLELVGYAFRGIQACVVYLIISSGIKMFKGLKKNPMSMSILAVTCLLMVGFSLLAIDFSTIIFIIVSGCIGLAVYGVGRLKNERGAKK